MVFSLEDGNTELINFLRRDIINVIIIFIS